MRRYRGTALHSDAIDNDTFIAWLRLGATSATRCCTSSSSPRWGVHISIDDFGTGYSRLSYLRKLPVSELKIDRSFVLDLETNGDACAVVEAVVELAHTLG